MKKAKKTGTTIAGIIFKVQRNSVDPINAIVVTSACFVARTELSLEPIQEQQRGL